MVIKVKYFSPMTHLCIVRIARGIAARTTWAAVALLDRVGGGEGYRVVPHVIHVSGKVSLRLCIASSSIDVTRPGFVVF